MMLGAVIMLLTSSYYLHAQTTLGVTGLLNSPSADMSPDKTIKFGANYLPIGFLPGKWDYNTFNFYLNITFVPFAEIALTNTAFDIWNQGRFSNVDRAICLRVRPLKEGKYWPAVVVGSNDVLTTGAGLGAGTYGNKYFGTSYIALSKHFDIGGNKMGIHTAYNIPVSNYVEQAFPISGGVSFSPKFYKDLNIIAEYDTKHFNLGANIIVFKYLYFQFFLNQFRYPVFGFQTQFTI
jgi:hypothetical protein